jgi:hypothetical protein
MNIYTTCMRRYINGIKTTCMCWYKGYQYEATVPVLMVPVHEDYYRQY